MGTLEEDGWDFWLRVYSDSTLRNEMIVEHQDEPYLSEILSDEKLKSTKVIIENLPRSCSNQDLKNLLEAKIGCAKVINIRIIGNRGFVTFYEGKDALASIDHFNGKMFRGGFLKVRPDEAKRGGWTKKGPIEDNNSQMASLGHDTSFSSAKSIQTHIHTDSGNFTGDEPSSLSPTSEPDSDRRLIGRSDSTISLNCDRRPICSHIECIEKLANLLSEYGPVKYNDQRITDFFLDKPSYIQLTYFCWPLAAFRTRNQLLRIVGGYLCLPKDEIVAIDLSSNDGLNYICRDTWEPIAPCQIWNNSDLAKYALAFLKHFGPSWLGDLPFTYLMFSLPCSWQRDAQDLANIIEREVPSVISIQDTLYLTSLPDHRQAAARAIRRGPI